MALELYAWQRECLQVWKDNGYRGVINVITGAGKTVFSMAGTQQVLTEMSRTGDGPIPFEDVPLRVFVVVPTIPLALQWGHELKKWFPGLTSGTTGLGYYYGERKCKSTCRMIVYVINSARYALARHAMEAIKKGETVLLIADECHHYTSAENRKIFDFMKEPGFVPERLYTLGLSATPQNANFDTVMVPTLGPLIYSYGFNRAITERNITPYAVLQIAVQFTAEENDQYQDLSDQILNLWRALAQAYPEIKQMDMVQLLKFLHRVIEDKDDAWEQAEMYLNLIYKRAGLTRNAKARTECAMDLIDEMPRNVRILIFCERIGQAEKVYSDFSKRFRSTVNRYHSKMDRAERKRILEAFRSGEVRILICCRALDEGLDVPDAAIGIVLASTSTARQRIQRLGRILRKSPDKPLASLYYVYVNGSSDLTQYLQDDSATKISNLRYLSDEHNFIHERYETLCTKLLDEESRRMTEAQVSEMRRCLLEGMLVPDWLLEPEAYDDLIGKSRNQHTRNYWICMKKIAVLASTFRDMLPNSPEEMQWMEDELPLEDEDGQE